MIDSHLAVFNWEVKICDVRYYFVGLIFREKWYNNDSKN